MPGFEPTALSAGPDPRVVAPPPAGAEATAPRPADSLRQRLAHLEAAHAELQATAAVVAHDLRTPLAQIEGFADMLVEGGQALDTDARRQIEVVIRAARRMSRMVVDLLELAHIDSTPMRRTPVALDRVVARLQAAPPAMAPEKTGAIEWSIGALPGVCGDATLLGLAFEQLVAEAVRYSGAPERPQVRIEHVKSVAPDEVVIVVEAQGIGSQPPGGVSLRSARQPGNPAGRPGGSGGGIGLTVARRIVARHGGRIWAEPTSGGGASFFMALPR